MYPLVFILDRMTREGKKYRVKERQSEFTVLAENRLEHLLKPVTGSSGSKVFVMIKSGTSASMPLILQLA